MKPRLALSAVLLVATSLVGPTVTHAAAPARQCAPTADYPARSTPVAFWSTEARCAIVPASPTGVFGLENYGTKFPGEAAVYMGIVHLAIYDAAVAIEGGYEPYAIDLHVPDASIEAAVATAAFETLLNLPTLGLGPRVIFLAENYDAYMATIPDGIAKERGTRVGEAVALAVLTRRDNDGLELNPSLSDLNPPSPAPAVWTPGPGPVLGLRLPGVRPLALSSAAQFRPDGPPSLASRAYAEDFNQVKDLGRIDSDARTAQQTVEARFWTDHDLRMWNDGLLDLAATRDLGEVETARMLAMAHVAGGDAMIACFEAKFHYWFWRPYQAIANATIDGNDATSADPTWQPLATTPNFPEYPSAHACHSGAVVAALDAFFGTDRIGFSLESRVTGTTETYGRLHDVVKDVDWARVLVGFHFRSSDLEGSNLGRRVGRFVADHLFLPLH